MAMENIFDDIWAWTGKTRQNQQDMVRSEIYGMN